ncbi:MAG: hypothetical protein ACRCYP_01615 [Alphaproteobacteria bacterium]
MTDQDLEEVDSTMVLALIILLAFSMLCWGSYLKGLASVWCQKYQQVERSQR